MYGFHATRFVGSLESIFHHHNNLLRVWLIYLQYSKSLYILIAFNHYLHPYTFSTSHFTPHSLTYLQFNFASKKMIISILLLAVIFIAGLMTTNLPSKLFALFMTSSVKNPNSSPPDVEFVTKSKSPAVAGCRGEKKSNSWSNKDELKRIFDTFDKNGDGNITKQELKESLKNMGMALSETDIEELIWTVDSNEDGLIDLDEFCESFESLLSTKGGTEEEEEEEEGGKDGERELNLKEAFDVFDEDKDGVITVEELGLVLSSMGFTEGNRLEECSKMIKEVDIDGDGMVNFDEFKKMMKHGSGFVGVA